MVSRLQRRFSRSKVLRRGMLEMLGGMGTRTGRGYKRLWYDVIADVYGCMTEAEIKCFLFHALNCYDLTADERAEVLQLLQMTRTALTTRQLEQIAFSL